MTDIYHPRSEKGGGLRIAKITDKNGQVVKLERLDPNHPGTIAARRLPRGGRGDSSGGNFGTP
ncbi:MAG: hypothetical protein KJ606_01825 [Chloroflexi bacterium]|nr:hypothetical protein [Chloroflexota bacterium]